MIAVLNRKILRGTECAFSFFKNIFISGISNSNKLIAFVIAHGKLFPFARFGDDVPMMIERALLHRCNPIFAINEIFTFSGMGQEYFCASTANRLRWRLRRFRLKITIYEKNESICSNELHSSVVNHFHLPDNAHRWADRIYSRQRSSANPQCILA